MLASDVMTKGVLAVRADTTVEEIASMLLSRSISAVPVVDAEDRVIGIVSEGDLMRRTESETYRRPSWWLELVSDPASLARDYVKTHGRRASDVMTRHVISVTEDTPVDKIASLLDSRRIKRVPVVREGKLVGVVSRADLLRALVRAPRAAGAPLDDKTIHDALMQKMRDEAWVGRLYLNAVVQDGEVQLWGQVETEEEKDAVRLLAEGVPGVKAVRTHLNIRPIASYAS